MGQVAVQCCIFFMQCGGVINDVQNNRDIPRPSQRPLIESEITKDGKGLMCHQFKVKH